ncbi:MAG: flagellar hook-length control protein FliK [Hyphomonadaceae bacterium]
MTAADALSVQPTARPEPSVARAAAPENKAGEPKEKSFSDALDAETTAKTKANDKAEKSETNGTLEKPADLATSDDVPADAVIVATPTQPVPPQATPVMASPAAILAGLDPNAVVAEGASATPAIDGVKPTVNPEIAIDTPAPALAKIEADLATVEPDLVPAVPVEQEVVAQQVAVVTQPAVATPAKPAAKKDAKVETADPVTDTAEPGSSKVTAETTSTEPVANATPTQPGVTARALPTTAEAPQQTTQSTSGPGSERAATAIEAAPAATTKPATANAKAASGADANTQASANKTVQAVATTADAAPELKIDAATSSITSTSATDALTASRTSGAEAGKAAQSNPALQAAPAATIQVYSRMIERFDGRAQRYEIRLDPAELGRVDIRIEVGADKKVHAVLAAHDSAALSDMMRGQRALEASLRRGRHRRR